MLRAYRPVNVASEFVCDALGFDGDAEGFDAFLESQNAALVVPGPGEPAVLDCVNWRPFTGEEIAAREAAAAKAAKALSQLQKLGASSLI